MNVRAKPSSAAESAPQWPRRPPAPSIPQYDGDLARADNRQEMADEQLIDRAAPLGVDGVGDRQLAGTGPGEPACQVPEARYVVDTGQVQHELGANVIRRVLDHRSGVLAPRQ